MCGLLLVSIVLYYFESVHGGLFCTKYLKKSSPQCPQRVNVIDLQKFINLILDEHNFRRNVLAAGRINLFPQAAGMATMYWDKELASMAEITAQQCSPTLDHICQNLKNFENVAELKEEYTYEGFVDRFSDNYLIRLIIKRLWKTWRFANPSQMKKFTDHASRWAQFAVMANDVNQAVGCAAARYVLDGKQVFSLVCNYGWKIMPGDSVYVQGQPGSLCHTGKNPMYPKLCSENEVYVNT